MTSRLRWPVLGVIAAVAVTSSMDATGLTAFSALPLAVLLAAFCYLQGISRKQAGLMWGQGRTYFLACCFP